MTGSCTFEPGKGFATIESANFSAMLIPGVARDLGGNKILTYQGHYVTVNEFKFGIDVIELEDLAASGGGESVTFDPAHPPPGYTFCHGGHCHSEDGRLVAYEDIQDELSHGTVQSRNLVSFPFEKSVDLLEEKAHVLEKFDPSRELPESTISRVNVDLTSIEINATIVDDSDGLEQETILVVNLDIDESISVATYRLVDREQPETIRLFIELNVDGTFFDNLDFTNLFSQQENRIDDEEHEVALALLQSVLKSKLWVSF